MGPRVLSAQCEVPFEEEYITEGLLGEGAFAAVWKCRSRETGEHFACKALPKDPARHVHGQRQRQRQRHGQGLGQEAVLTAHEDAIRREVGVMSLLLGPHPGVVHICDALEDEGQVHLIVELCAGGNLMRLLNARGAMPEPAVRDLAHQLASALVHCHAQGIIHRDVKPENILFDHDPGCLYDASWDLASGEGPCVQAKLGDFGLAVVAGPEASTRGFAGSKYYVAPEVLRSLAYDSRVDVWSLGVVLCAMLTGVMPFSGSDEGDDKGLVRAILGAELDLTMPEWRAVSAGAKDLVSRMLQRDPAERPCAQEVLSHPWILGCTRGPLDLWQRQVREGGLWKPSAGCPAGSRTVTINGP